MRHLTHGEGVRVPALDRRLDLWLMLAIPLGLVVGLAVANGGGIFVLVPLVALAALATVVLRPETVLLLWFLLILANGRWFTHHGIGPLFVTEPFLALVTAGAVLRLILATEGHAQLAARAPALRFLSLLSAVVLLPGLAAFLLRTSEYDQTAARNVLLILYVLFAFIAASLTDLGRTYRRWFAVALAGPAIAVFLVVTGMAGSQAITSTGAVRIAAHSFPLAFGLGAIVLIAAARERLIRPIFALGAIPFLVALLLVNHRSAWLAFVAAAVVLFAKRLSAPVIVGTAAILACGVLLFTETLTVEQFGDEVQRARTVTSTSDPNARYRLDYWGAVLSESAENPFIGSGFDAYPSRLVPVSRRSSSPTDPVPDPHNSFLAIGYRIGLIPLVVLLGMLGHLLRLGFRASRSRPDPRDRAICSSLTAMVVFVGVTSAFNVFLEAPYAGPLFWTAVGLLAHRVFANSGDALVGAASARAVRTA